MPQTSRMPPLRRTLGGGIERGRRARGSPCICGAWRGFLRRCILPRQEREALRPAGIPAKRAEQHNIMQISRPRERTRQLSERPAITAERVYGPTFVGGGRPLAAPPKRSYRIAIHKRRAPCSPPPALWRKRLPTALLLCQKPARFSRKKMCENSAAQGAGNVRADKKNGCRLTPTAARCSLLCFARKVPQND